MKVRVVGAGFSGLAAAFHLQKAGYAVEIYEKSPRPGGLIATHKTPHGLVETAANGLINSPLVAELFKAAGVKMVTPLPEARARYIFRDGKPRRWPLRIIENFRFLVFLFRYFFKRQSLRPEAGESVAQWGERALSRALSQVTIETALQGVYAGDSQQMSACLTLGALFRAKKPAVQPRGTVAPKGGMQELIDQLTRYLEAQGVKFFFDSSFQIGGAPSGPVVLATSAAQAAELLLTFDPPRAQALRQVQLLPVVTATVFFKTVDSQLRGFGGLFPPAESRGALGVLMNSSIFAERARDCRSETWILGGALHPECLQMTDHEILQLIESERSRVMGLKSTVLEAVITRWPAAFPHYTIALEKLQSEFNVNRRGVFLIGNYVSAIGLGQILEQAANLPTQIQQETK